MVKLLHSTPFLRILRGCHHRYFCSVLFLKSPVWKLWVLPQWVGHEQNQETSLHRSPANAVHDNLCAILVHNHAVMRCEQGLGGCNAWRGRRCGCCCRACTSCCWCTLRP